MQKFTLEKSRFFPYIAWAVVIGFTIFVGTLTIQLQDSLTELEKATQHTNSSLTPPL